MVPGAEMQPSPVPLDNDQDSGLHVPEGKLIPELQCIFYLTLQNSSMITLFEKQMRSLGLWDRVIVHASTPDPEGKAAGCLRAHVAGWNQALDMGCTSAMMLEEDVFFEETVVEKGLERANKFLESGTHYDMFMLGWTVGFDKAGLDDVMLEFQEPEKMYGKVSTFHDDKYECIYKCQFWRTTQSYIISSSFMRKNKDLVWAGKPIDVLFGNDPNNTYVTLRPNIGFQRYHLPAKGEVETGGRTLNGGTGEPYPAFKMIPGVQYSIFDPELYVTKANIMSPPQCLPPPDAFSWTGLRDVLWPMMKNAAMFGGNVARNVSHLGKTKVVKQVPATFCFPYAETPPPGAPPLPPIMLPMPEILHYRPQLYLPVGWPKTCLTLEEIMQQVQTQLAWLRYEYLTLELEDALLDAPRVLSALLNLTDLALKMP